MPIWNPTGGGVTLPLDHTNPADIISVGINTHAQIDSHIANFSNPHATTAAQVGADPAGTAVAVVALHVAAADPHPQYELDANKGVANGYAPLDAGSRVPLANLVTGVPTGAKFFRDDRTLAQVDYSQLTGVPASFTPSAHASTHAGIGSDPVNHNTLQNYVANQHVDHSTVSITGTLSLTGGGDITASRTLSLVNDAASPGNSKYYGTDGAGTKGFFNLPSGGSAAATTVEVNLGSTASFRGTFTITDAAIDASKKVLAWQAPGPYTGKGTRADEAEMQPVQVVTVVPGAGSALVYWQTPPMETQQRVPSVAGDPASNMKDPQAVVAGPNCRIGRVRGNVKFSYSVFA